MYNETVPNQIADPASPSPRVRGRFAPYLFWIIIPAIVFYLLPWALIRVPSFEEWGGTVYGPSLDYGFNTAGQNADVVIFGDSSALYGVAPRVISEQTGLKVLNLPNTGGSLRVTDDMVLRRYLQHNKPPRLIVFYFAPWDLDYRTSKTTAIFEGEQMLLRHGSLADVLAFARQYPTTALEFPFQLYSVSPKVTLLALIRHQDRVSTIRETMGHLDNLSTHGYLGGSACHIPADLIARTEDATVRALDSTYRSPATRVLNFVAPVPTCDNASEVSGRSYAEVPAAAPKKMQSTLYLSDGFYIHLAPSAVPAASHTLADAIRSDFRQAKPQL
jgi:hypothetical protein